MSSHLIILIIICAHIFGVLLLHFVYMCKHVMWLSADCERVRVVFMCCTVQQVGVCVPPSRLDETTQKGLFCFGRNTHISSSSGLCEVDFQKVLF